MGRGGEGGGVHLYMNGRDGGKEREGETDGE